jgi:glucose/arabinose dehydrogenase
MRTRAPIQIAVLTALGVAVAACGASGSSSGTASAPVAAASTTTGPASATTRAGTGKLTLKQLGSFDSPVYVTAAPGDNRRLFVVEQGGRIRIIRGGKVVGTPFLDIRRLVTAGGEQGLLSVAFAPDYAKSGRFYVYYTDKQQQQRVVEYRRASADRANAGSARLVLKMADQEPNHNGGLLMFGPDDLLYVGTGDGGGADDQHGARGNAQNLSSPLGKLLRINPRRSGGRAYTIPADNPFAQRSGVRREIYSYGLRNPWRYSFDRSTGALVIGDVGQGAVEEVDYVAKGKGSGANFGWRPFEGSRRHSPGESAPGAIAPVLQLTHDDGNCSITGGYVIRDKGLPASVRGRYVYGDFCKGDLRAATLSPTSATGDASLGLKHIGSLSSFGEDNQGRIYVVSLDGPVYRLTVG